MIGYRCRFGRSTAASDRQPVALARLLPYQITPLMPFKTLFVEYLGDDLGMLEPSQSSVDTRFTPNLDLVRHSLKPWGHQEEVQLTRKIGGIRREGNARN